MSRSRNRSKSTSSDLKTTAPGIAEGNTTKQTSMQNSVGEKKSKSILKEPLFVQIFGGIIVTIFGFAFVNYWTSHQREQPANGRSILPEPSLGSFMFIAPVLASTDHRIENVHEFPDNDLRITVGHVKIQQKKAIVTSVAVNRLSSKKELIRASISSLTGSHTESAIYDLNCGFRLEILSPANQTEQCTEKCESECTSKCTSSPQEAHRFFVMLESWTLKKDAERASCSIRF